MQLIYNNTLYELYQLKYKIVHFLNLTQTLSLKKEEDDWIIFISIDITDKSLKKYDNGK